MDQNSFHKEGLEESLKISKEKEEKEINDLKQQQHGFLQRLKLHLAISYKFYKERRMLEDNMHLSKLEATS